MVVLDSSVGLDHACVEIGDERVHLFLVQRDASLVAGSGAFRDLSVGGCVVVE